MQIELSNSLLQGLGDVDEGFIPAAFHHLAALCLAQRSACISVVLLLPSALWQAPGLPTLGFSS